MFSRDAGNSSKKHTEDKITQYVDCVTKEVGSIPAFEMISDWTVELFQKQMT